MQKKSVAVIDVGSSKIVGVVAERGVNGTFVVKGRYTCEYDGYADGAFLDVKSLARALDYATREIKRITLGEDTVFYVGVPAEFIRTEVKESNISLGRRRKITREDVSGLFDMAFVMASSKYLLINRSAIFYELDGGIRTNAVIGKASETLKGLLSFLSCSKYFIDMVSAPLNGAGAKTVRFVPTELAEGRYLLDGRNFNRLSVMLDVGYISSSFTVMRGNGIIFSDAFSYGGGYITANLIKRLDVDFDTAEKLKRKVNLCSVPTDGGSVLIEGSDGKFYDSEQIKESVLYSLDELCSKIFETIDKFGNKLPDYSRLFVTGGGITFLRGAREYVSERLGIPVDIVYPKVPLMDKPSESSVLSLLDYALG